MLISPDGKRVEILAKAFRESQQCEFTVAAAGVGGRSQPLWRHAAQNDRVVLQKNIESDSRRTTRPNQGSSVDPAWNLKTASLNVTLALGAEMLVLYVGIKRRSERANVFMMADQRRRP